MTGFTTAWDGNIVVLAACQGKRHHVVNIGLGVKRLSADGVPVQQWAQSQQHKVLHNFRINIQEFLFISLFS